MPPDRDPPPVAAVLVPVKAFGRAKGRLAEVLDDDARARLARAMADRVLTAAHPLPAAVVCDDDGVALWARAAGARVIRADRAGLNAAVGLGVEELARRGVTRVVIAHADLPFAAGLAALAVAEPTEVVLVPDRRGDGTNVMSIPTGAGMTFHYGPGSFDAHRAAAARCDLPVRVVDSGPLGWDVDEPDDLDPPPEWGTVAEPATGTAQ